MIKAPYKLFFMAIMFFLAANGYSQTLPDSLKATLNKALNDTVKKKSSIKVGANYTSNNVFMGRTGLTTTPIISPDIKYTHKSGLYVSGTLDYLPDNKKNKVDGGDVSAGYEFDITDSFSGDVSYTKLFYSTNSTQIGSSMSSTFNANFDYDISDIITPSISFDYDINKQGINNDAFLAFDISHDIVFEKIFAAKDFIFISPTITVNAGTQNFYDAFLTQKVFKKAKKEAAQTALINKFEQNVDQFKLLDDELSMPVEYKINHFIFSFIPTYAIVENEFKSAAIAKELGVPEKPSVFYFTAGAALKF
ncbi:hypothetical protein SAMN05216490_4556 [Mucilaginibacter mallensis]|uniref:Uncharacterized protein n=1 Tax=Mucilaginibacter mallensis TaxID=652787 RepID=A0A1H2C2L7_MUCMA|nr:hypothetical protein [Mucilaginibacter mallensis]SDT64537.1 hypothetical protein SAMN05216490_4556 [Mucilaginibacter mallensis]